MQFLTQINTQLIKFYYIFQLRQTIPGEKWIPIDIFSEITTIRHITLGQVDHHSGRIDLRGPHVLHIILRVTMALMVIGHHRIHIQQVRLKVEFLPRNIVYGHERRS